MAGQCVDVEPSADILATLFRCDMECQRLIVQLDDVNAVGRVGNEGQRTVEQAYCYEKNNVRDA